MNVRIAVTGTVLAALVLPATASAKGASAAKIEGPGLSSAIVLKSDNSGDPSAGSKLGRLAQESGFFALVFGQTPDPTVSGRVKSILGTRYRVTYTMPGPNGESSKLRQDLYPYAKPYPVSYMKPGQSFWGGQKTHGGWYIGSASLRSAASAAGVPAPARTTAPPSSDGGGWLSGRLVTALVIAVAVALVAAGAVAVRRRPRPAH
jgi:hypothetical protein